MKTVVAAVMVLLIAVSAGVGYFVGTSVTSTTTTSTRIQAPKLSVVNASWVNSYTGYSGSCGTGYSGSSPFGRPYSIGFPEVTCYLTINASESGTINLNVSNSGNKTDIAFDADSSYPYMVFFVNSQGCIPFDASGFCGAIAGNSTAAFQLTFLATPGTYSPINVTLDVELAVLSSSS
jgi:hypothetical protein